MVRFALLAAFAVVGWVAPAVAQFGRPVIVVSFGYGYGYGWGGYWVPPPVIVVRPAVPPRFEEPREPEPIRATPADRAAAEARVSAAVDRGEHCRLHVCAHGVAPAVERADLLIHPSWIREAMGPHDDVHFCVEAVSMFQAPARFDINA